LSPQKSASDRRGFWRGATFALGARTLQVVYGLVAIPIGLWYFGPETYGAWLVVSSVVSYASLAAVGVPTTVLTWTAMFGVAHADRVLRRGVAVTATMAAVLGVVLALVAVTQPEARIAALVGSTDPQVGRAIIIMLVATLASLPLAPASSSLAGLGRVDAQQTIQGAQLAVNLVALLLAVGAGLTLVGMSGLILVGRVGVGLFAMGWQRRVMGQLAEAPAEPSPRECDPLPGRREFLSSAVRYLLLGLQSTVTMNLDQLVLAHVIGPAVVPAYVAVLRMVQALNLVVTSVLAPAWPNFSSRLRPGVDREPAARLLSATLTISQLGMVFCAVPMLLLGERVLELWLRDGAAAQQAEEVLLPLVAWALLYVSAQVQGTFLSAADRTGVQTVLGFADAGINLALSIALAHTLGAPGVALATLLSTLLILYPGFSVLVRRVVGVTIARSLNGAQLGGLAWPFALLVPAILQVGRIAWGVQVTVVVVGIVLAALGARGVLQQKLQVIRSLSGT
jgi:O-antigen/teichoic acid export membrane protein